jgi:MOSC domain-containing protein YiiM
MTASYRITTGDGRSTEELVAAGHYGYAHSCVDSENFPVRKVEAGQVREIVLLAFDHDVTSDEATTAAARVGLERPTYEDALYFGIAYPDVQRERPVVFLHDPWFGFFGRRDVLCLWSNAGRRELGLEGFDDRWGRQYRFAFARAGEAGAMTARLATVDSETTGDPGRFRTLADLERELGNLRASRESGRVALIVRRGEGGLRETPDRIWLSPETGVTGDTWGRQPNRGQDMQIAVMQADVAELVANGQPLTLFGDSLFLELDLSTPNLPAGSRVRVGGAVLEVTPVPHNGCRKFQGRFGQDALRFVSMKELRHRNLRGIYMRVVEPGEAGPGDAVEVMGRPAATAQP